MGCCWTKNYSPEAKFHAHPLEVVPVQRGERWKCDGCGKSGSSKKAITRYRCTQGCDFDLCDICFAEVAASTDLLPPVVAKPSASLLGSPHGSPCGSPLASPRRMESSKTVSKDAEALPAGGLSSGKGDMPQRKESQESVKSLKSYTSDSPALPAQTWYKDPVASTKQINEHKANFGDAPKVQMQVVNAATLTLDGCSFDVLCGTCRRCTPEEIDASGRPGS
eukprot:gnl/TRDRNA2_/TRDRNA2_99656_c0_seq2.p1 gnl/TRDRNA2_/TRDRNA2_99656_c0~~gnl/TRDRNA2_/TRDRNA2_99656_c0_seq2.p1  ORF type:complete len:222 (-),score=39.11 gnl/TRDRNA2_/TRDRNA2_99656_c0_seq2:12-677(-)